jgi:hypothetical protein
MGSGIIRKSAAATFIDGQRMCAFTGSGMCAARSPSVTHCVSERERGALQYAWVVWTLQRFSGRSERYGPRLL